MANANRRPGAQTLPRGDRERETALYGDGKENGKKTVARGEAVESQLRNLLEALEAVRRGDLTKRLRKDRYDIFGEIADSYNGMLQYAD